MIEKAYAHGMGVNEQIGDSRRHIHRRSWRYIKRSYAKWRRREEKRDLENTPTRREYRGWSS